MHISSAHTYARCCFPHAAGLSKARPLLASPTRPFHSARAQTGRTSQHTHIWVSLHESVFFSFSERGPTHAEKRGTHRPPPVTHAQNTLPPEASSVVNYASNFSPRFVRAHRWRETRAGETRGTVLLDRDVKGVRFRQRRQAVHSSSFDSSRMYLCRGKLVDFKNM